MMGPMPAGVRNLLRAALIIFVLTIVIGILNGTDVWDPPRNTLLTHVHSGTLGWITLSVFAAAIWMVGEGESARNLANYSIFAVSLYVLAFWSVDLTDAVSIQRPIGGTLAFVAMAWAFVWFLGRMRNRIYDVARFGMMLALLFLVLGAILGVLLGLQLANVEIVVPEETGRLAEAHPGAMVAGFVVLAALALIEWLIQRDVPTLSESKLGAVRMILLFAAGLGLVGGGLLQSEELLQMAVPLQVVGTLVLLGRHRKRLAPSEWAGVVPKMVRTAILGLIVVVALIAYLVSQLVGGAEFGDVAHVAVTFDHVNFIMVTTNLIFAMLILGSRVPESVNRLVFWGTNIGVAGFAVGIILQNDVLKRIFTPILGVALLYGIYHYLTATGRISSEAAPAQIT